MSKEREKIIDAGTVVVDNEKILLVQEAGEPSAGKWNFPLGKIEASETIVDAAVRETKEETGLQVELTDFLGIWQSLSIPGLNVIIFMFKARVVDGNLQCDKRELLQVRWFTLQEFAELADTDLFHPEMRNTVQRAFSNQLPKNVVVVF